MRTPRETVDTYLKQLKRKLLWLAVAVAAGTVAAVAVRFGTGWDYPAWRVGVLVAGLVFVPVLIRHGFSRDLVSAREAWAGGMEIRKAGE